MVPPVSVRVKGVDFRRRCADAAYLLRGSEDGRSVEDGWQRLVRAGSGVVSQPMSWPIARFVAIFAGFLFSEDKTHLCWFFS